MRHRITLISGDGIGPKISDATVRCVEATGLDVDWDTHDAGGGNQRNKTKEKVR